MSGRIKNCLHLAALVCVATAWTLHLMRSKEPTPAPVQPAPPVAPVTPPKSILPPAPKPEPPPVEEPALKVDERNPPPAPNAKNYNPFPHFKPNLRR